MGLGGGVGGETVTVGVAVWCQSTGGGMFGGPLTDAVATRVQLVMRLTTL